MSKDVVTEEVKFHLDKAGVLQEIEEEIAALQSRMSVGRLPAFYYFARIRLLERLQVLVKKLNFIPLKPKDGWNYHLRQDSYSYKVELINAGFDENHEPFMHTVIFAEVKARMMSAEEFGQAFDIGAGSVRQWIRRGKLPEAVKVGAVWRISELSLPKGRGYDFRFYTWDKDSCSFDKELAFLNDYDAVSLEQLKDGSFLIVPRKKDKNGNLINILPLAKDPNQEGITMTMKEKECFELQLIENPLVTYQTMSMCVEEHK